MKKFKVPLLSVPDKPIENTSQNFISVSDITNDLILFRDGGAAVVMESTSLNFGLLSEKEQQAVIAAYAALINSLSFPLQIMVRSQRKDISSYMDYLDDAEKKIKNEKLLGLMQNYKQFVSETVKKKNVLGKSFYMVIPFSPLELGVTKAIMSTAQRNKPLPYPKKYVIKKAKIVLYPKRDHLIRQARRLGIRLKQLNTSELISLVYSVFNPKKPIVMKKDYEVK